jgi:predicted DNA-binding transcriptional regulator AlpA
VKDSSNNTATRQRGSANQQRRGTLQAGQVNPVRPNPLSLADAAPENDNYLKPPAAADYVGASVSTLAKLRVVGGGPRYVRIGRAIRYRKRDLDMWMDLTAAHSTSEYR